MIWQDYAELTLFVLILAVTAKPLGIYMSRVFGRERTWLDPVLLPFERLIYRVCQIRPDEDQGWVSYTRDLLVFSAIGIVFTYGILRLQQFLPLNPQNFANLPWHLALNTAISFATNTNWQSYGGESTLSYASQMIGLTLHNFLSAAVGMAVAAALIRSIGRKQSKGIGNFWSDMVRSNLYILLPICLIYAIFLLSQGVIQNFSAYTEVTTLEGVKQLIAQGPVASQVAIKMLGTNGGGFFNANAAHPFENPTALSNFIQMLSILMIPSALFYMLGYQLKSTKHGWSVWVASALIMVAGVFIVAHYEYVGTPKIATAGLTSTMNLEGKEARFGVFDSALFATVTTDASCGAVNSMHDSFTPLGGIVPLVNIMLGEVVFGGVGSGLYGMVLFIILTVFISGLMVGRTPEYRGKRIEGREVKLAMFAVIVAALSILGFAALGVIDVRGLAGLGNPGAHGLSEILYAVTSATGNNGSAFAGLNANTPFWNLTLAGAMFAGRYLMMIPLLAIAGSLGVKKMRAETAGTFPVHGPLFVTLLVGVMVIVGALTYFPALTLGPILEHFQMNAGQTF